MMGIGSIAAAAPWAPPPAALPPDGVLSIGDGAATVAWALAGLLALSAAALLGERRVMRRSAWLRRRLPVACHGGLDPRAVMPSRSRAGGTSGRVPPRPAAGSPLRGPAV